MRLYVIIVLSVLLTTLCGSVFAEDVREYVVKRSGTDVVIDGVLDEICWEKASFTETFVFYTDGAEPKYKTKAQMLWDNDYLYIAMTMTDEDVWGEMVERDDKLYREEVAEIFVDPDGDGSNYIEIEVNPLGTLMDLLMSKEYSQGGKSDWDWNLEGFLIGIGVGGTLNDSTDTDTEWILECALQFSDIAFAAPTMHYPPEPGDEWRLNLYRYDYDRTGEYINELTAWNQTDKRGFHAPDKFGCIIFSDEPVTGTGVDTSIMKPEGFTIIGSSPNPFNPSTTIEYSLTEHGFAALDIFNALGQKIRSLDAGSMNPGRYTATWNGLSDNGDTATSGVYFVRLSMGERSVSHRILLVK